MMNIKTLFLLTIALVVYACAGKTENSNETLATEDQSEGWVLLSEGDLSDHWEMYNQGEMKGWTLEDGELHSSGAGWDADEDIITKQAYDNFELSLAWKVAPENSSGIFYHVQKGSEPIYEAAPEYQVMDDAGWPQEMEPNQYTAANYAMHAPENAELKPVGEWNTTKIIIDYPHVEHWLNGTKVVAYELGSEDWKARKASGKWAEVPSYGVAKSGHIGLQNAGEVVYRNIKIREL
jgi:hypothetical protein